MQLDDNQIKKQRTKGTAKMTLELTKNLELSSMLSDIFIYSEDEFAKELIKKYEAQLVLALVEPVKFEQGLHVFYKETYKYIKKNNLFKEFYSFAYFVFSSLSAKREDKKNKSYYDALNCYYNLLFQQMNYFVPHPKIAYGLESNGKLMLRNELYPNLDIAIMKLYANNKKNPTRDDLYKSFKKYGYDIHSEFEFRQYHSNDQLVTNMILVMAYFINENTININPKEYYLVANGISLMNKKTETDVYEKILREKRYFLPMKGVIGQYKNCEDIKEVFYQEVFTENRIILLYKVTATNGKEFSGFYDTKLELFYSPWDDTNFGTGYHKKIENFILENYAYLTTDIDEKLKEMEVEKRLYLTHEIPVISLEPLPSVEYIYNEKDENTLKGNTSREGFRIFDKRKYQDTKVSIHPFIRRLPEGAKASEEAIALAKQYHYVLREGETFVRPFERTTYRKK